MLGLRWLQMGSGGLGERGCKLTPACVLRLWGRNSRGDICTGFGTVVYIHFLVSSCYYDNTSSCLLVYSERWLLYDSNFWSCFMCHGKRKK